MRKLKGAFMRSFLLLVVFAVAMGIFVVLNGCAGSATGDCPACYQRWTVDNKCYPCSDFADTCCYQGKCIKCALAKPAL